MMEVPEYPLPAEQWIRRKAVASDLEIIAAHKRGYVQSDGAVARLWAKLDCSAFDVLAAMDSDQRRCQSLLDKYFALLLINLFEQWFLLEKPKKALEYLVTSLRDSQLIWIGDKRLPSRTAGISETYETPAGFDPEEFRVNVRIHNTLSNYVCELMAHDLLSHAIV